MLLCPYQRITEKQAICTFLFKLKITELSKSTFMKVKYTNACIVRCSPWAETWRRVWGDGNKFRGPIKFVMTFFLVIDRFSVFCLSLLSEIRYITYMTIFLTKNLCSEQNIPPLHLF